MKFVSKAVVVAFALSAVSSVGFAAGEKGGGAAGAGAGGMPSFTEADKDSSGSIERSEAQSITGLDFSSADADSDGKLSRSEYEAATKTGGAPSPGGAGGSPGGGMMQPGGGMMR